MAFITKNYYRPEIDGLRAFAVVAVIINHFNKDFLPNGYLGVDIFFIISGYVITSSLSNKKKTNFIEFISEFYSKRLKRLIPALCFYVLIASLLICLVNPSPLISINTGITSLFGLSNFYLLRLSTDYFSQSAQLNVFTHTWSLAVEEQFYFAFPFILWFSGFTKHNPKGRQILSTIVLFLSIISLIFFVALYKSNQSLSYFLMPTRFWEIGSGCLLFLYSQKISLNRTVLNFPPIICVLLLILIMLLPISLALPATLLAVIFTLILITSLKEETLTYKLLTKKSVVYLGLISYSLYLWHWGILSISNWTIGIYWWTIPFQIILIALISNISYKYIESPFRKKDFLKLRWQAIFSGIFLLLITSASLIGLRKNIFRKFYLGDSSLSQKTWWKDEYGNYIENCHSKDTFNVELLKECLTTRNGNKRNIFLIGDSHARNNLSAIKEVFLNEEVYYLTMGSGCTFLPLEMIKTENQKAVKCSLYNTEVKKFLKENLKQNDVLFIGQALHSNYGRRLLQPFLDTYIKNLENFSKELNLLGVPLVLLDGVAPPKWDIRCTKEFFRPITPASCSISKNEVINRYSSFDTVANMFSSKYKNVYYISLREGLCIKDECGQKMKSGTKIWHDDGHITEDSSKELGPFLKQKLIKSGFQKYYGALK